MRVRFWPERAREAPPQTPPGPHLLFDGPVLSPWYTEYILQRELQRARRYGRPLSLLRAVPALLPGERLSDDAYNAAVRAAAEAARETDLIGGTDRGELLIIMTETEPDDARTGASRWRDQMWLCSRAVGGQKWRIEALFEIESIEKLRVFESEPPPQTLPEEDTGVWKVA